MSSLEIPLYARGWNLFAYPVQATQPVTKALLSISKYYTTVYGYDATDEDDPWKVYDKSLGAGDQYVNQLENLEFGKGYWISVTQAITLQIRGTPDITRAVTLAATGGMGSPPATYYGPVQASENMTVSAWVDGHFCGRGQTLEVNGEIVYSIDVWAEGPADNSGCGAQGRTVTFQVGDQVMLPSATWDNSRLWKLDLVSGYRVYLPLVIKQQ
jgi:hypothetical protein